MRISDWSSDVCSSDLIEAFLRGLARRELRLLLGKAALVGRELRFPILRQNALDDTLELGPAVAVEGGEKVLPRLVRGAAARAGLTPGVHEIVRHDAGRIRDREVLAGRGGFFPTP